jgi:hypothetical protein
MIKRTNDSAVRHTVRRELEAMEGVKKSTLTGNQGAFLREKYG